ncbi:c-type cytochrome [Abyssicoccus albus]|uniref:c-type cytochrome n=1 Tax=Abyssicoccus albus TaxID=1817405 RepID=UPI000F4D4304|nr:c-type cytochrome [Abyssicoccus albus]
MSEFSEAEQEKIKLGHQLNTRTNTMLPENVGNNLSCTSCHAGAGRGENLNLIGVTKKYPQYKKREGRDVTLKERINGCFIRSMNGKEIDSDGEEMEAFISYYEYLSKNIESKDQYAFMTEKHKGDNIPIPDPDQGEQDFKRYNCISCHGSSGPTAAFRGPALWGKDSFNDGAGMSRFSNMQYYIKNYMPKGRGGTLTEQEASNIAAYILLQDRPKFTGVNKFPNGDKPDDYINEKTREALKKKYMKWSDFDRVQDE